MSEQFTHWTRSRSNEGRCIIIGAGPAGLTAAYELSQTNITPLVFEQDKVVGGIARTVEYAGYRFDIGGHRFFTKVKLIDDWWKAILEDEFLVRSRQSRIYYDGRFFDYPLKPLNALQGLGPRETLRIALSYLQAQIFPSTVENTFEQWVCNRFGRRLYEIFFKSYTEKVWGMKCSEIGADWAAQRIKNLNLNQVVKSMFIRTNNEITTLITQFLYPRLGPGMLWEKVADILAERGFPVWLGFKVTDIHVSDRKIVGVSLIDEGGSVVKVQGNQFISSMPIKELVAAFNPPAPECVIQAAQKLRYRDFLTVGLIVDKANVFSDNWIYIHSPNVQVGRIQNFKNWSPDMVPDLSKTSLGLEYFVQQDDALWSAEDPDLIELAKSECSKLGLVDSEDVVDGVVIRMPKAYPVYDQTYRDNLSIIRNYVGSLSNLQLVGRNGQHRYNNQDHSMLTAIYAAQNILGASHDIWNVNVEDEYHEQAQRGPSTERAVPQVAQPTAMALLQSAFARYDPIALACALAVVPALALLILVMPLLLQAGGDSKLLILRNYLLGFDATWTGAAIGVLEISTVGFVFGYALAQMINYVVSRHERRLFRKLELLEALRRSSEPVGG